MFNGFSHIPQRKPLNSINLVIISSKVPQIPWFHFRKLLVDVFRKKTITQFLELIKVIFIFQEFSYKFTRILPKIHQNNARKKYKKQHFF